MAYEFKYRYTEIGNTNTYRKTTYRRVKGTKRWYKVKNVS